MIYNVFFVRLIQNLSCSQVIKLYNTCSTPFSNKFFFGKPSIIYWFHMRESDLYTHVLKLLIQQIKAIVVGSGDTRERVRKQF